MTGSNQSARRAATVADAMIHAPKVCSTTTTTAHAADMFADNHVHAVLIVDNTELIAVVERCDINTAHRELPARQAGRLRGRVTGPDADLDATWRAMTARGRRRLAVIDDHRKLLGLLCLKRTGCGFCSDVDVQARVTEQRAQRRAPHESRAANQDEHTGWS